MVAALLILWDETTVGAGVLLGEVDLILLKLDDLIVVHRLDLSIREYMHVVLWCLMTLLHRLLKRIVA